MAFWLVKRFKDHSSEFRDGYFVSPVTNDTCHLTRGYRHFAEAILDLWQADKTEPEGKRFGYRFTRNLIGEESGLEVSETLFFRATRELEQAGVFEIIREGELGNSKGFVFNLGALIKCEVNGCVNTKHYPADYPLQIDKPPIQYEKGEQAISQETPVNSLDIKNLNKPLRTLNTLKEIAKDFETLEIVAAEVAEVNQVKPATKELETPEALPPNWEAWTWASARRQRREQPSQIDIGYAWNTFEETGLDLDTGGAWIDGRPNPKPAKALQLGSN
jgi:hypothetical protein